MTEQEDSALPDSAPSAARPDAPPAMDDPDAALVSLARGGDARAFEALVVKYQRRIARHVARFVRRSGDVEDVVQEVFMRAYRGLPSFKGESAFYTWLYRIAHNTSMNHLRRAASPVVLSGDLGGSQGDERGDEGFEPGVTDGENPERILIARQIADAVQRAMTRLQPELAEALLLYEVEGKQYKEIAKMLGVPIGTVRTRIFRAREFIAARLQPVVGPVRDRRW